MTSPRNTDRLIQAFLDEGRDELPDRAYDAVRARIDHTRQRVVIGPWREEQMQRYAIFGVAAAAIVLVAVVGIQFLPRAGGVGIQPTPSNAPGPTATPTTAAATSAPPSASPQPLGQGGRRALSPGTYVAQAPFLARVTFTVPAAWEADVFGPDALRLNRIGGPAVGVFLIPDAQLYVDPCDASLGVQEPPTGPTSADLASAIAGAEQLGNPTVTDTDIGGQPAKHIVLTAPDSFDCTLPSGTRGFEVWQLPESESFWMEVDETVELWILDLASQRWMITTSQVARFQNGAFEDELQGVLDSLVIVPAN